jgi:putative colanic acid biosynthesis UDP-glucose lipid carrier transferase
MQISESEVLIEPRIRPTLQKIGPIPRLPLHIHKRGNRLRKRAVDLLVSSVLIITVLSWLLPLMAILILLDSPGPVFFLQKRRKRDQGLFTCIKLRTMIVNAEADTKSASKGDHRITRAGKCLRHTHLDELPQLFNVWRGDMSLIGPRPYMLSDDHHWKQLLPSYDQRGSVKPGITGLAQSWGYFGAAEDTEALHKRLRLDILYVEQWSIGMDIRILLRTLRFLAP